MIQHKVISYNSVCSSLQFRRVVVLDHCLQRVLGPLCRVHVHPLLACCGGGDAIPSGGRLSSDLGLELATRGGSGLLLSSPYLCFRIPLVALVLFDIVNSSFLRIDYFCCNPTWNKVCLYWQQNLHIKGNQRIHKNKSATLCTKYYGQKKLKFSISLWYIECWNRCRHSCSSSSSSSSRSARSSSARDIS